MKNRAFRKFVASIGVAAMVMSTATNAMSPAVTRAESAQELEGQQNDSQEQAGQEDPVAQSSDDTNGAPFADAETMAVSSEGSQDSQGAAGPSESSDSNGENGPEGSSGENTNASAGSTSAEASGAGSQDATGTMSGATNGTVGTTNSTITGTTNDTAGTINGATDTFANGTSADASTGTTTGENGEASGDNAEASTKEITAVITEDIDLGTYPAGEAPAYAQLELPDEIEVKVDEEKQTVTVTWNGEETYHPDQAGTYIFSSELDKEWNKDENGNARYQLAEKVELPKASVRVEKKAESTEDSKAEVKSDNKTENKTDAKLDIKEDDKTDAKADNKSEGKTEEKSDNKSEVTTKPETTKETTKDTSKENTKETSKKDSASKDKTKDETKNETKGEAKNEAKEETKTDTKDETAKADQKKKVTNAASLKAVYVAEDGTILCGTVGLTGDSFTISDKAKSFNGYELKTVTLGEEELPQDTAFTRNTSTTETKEEIRTEASYTYTMDGAEHEIAAGDTATITFTYAQKEEVTPEIASIEVTGEAVDTTGAAIQGDYAFPLAVGTNDLSKTAPYIQGYEYQYAEIGTDKITSIAKEVLEAGKYAYYVNGELLKENTRITYVYQEDEDYTEKISGTCGNLTVTVSASREAKLPGETAVQVTPVASARIPQILDKVSTLLGENAQNITGVLYDITLVKDGMEIQPKTAVHVTMKFDGGIPWNVPEGKQITDTAIVHLHGGVADVVTKDTENAEFETEGFSVYGMVATYEGGGSQTTQGIDLRGHITAVTVTRNGQTVSEETNIGLTDQLKFALSYTLPAGSLQQSTTLYYDLPSNFNMSGRDDSGLSGHIYDSGNHDVGTYVIDKATGKITIQITDKGTIDSNANNVANGSISFSCSASQASSGEGGQTTIGWNDEISTTLTIEEAKHTTNDLQVTKTQGNINESTGLIEYTITVTSEHGTKENVSLSDVMTTNSGIGLKYLHGFTVKKGDQDVTDSFQAPAQDASQFNLTIPKLNAGETYTITYWAKLDKENCTTTAKNSVTATSRATNDKKLEGKAEVSHEFKQNLIKKEGRNNNDGSVTWTVTVNEGNINLKGWTISDVLNGQEYKGSVSISPAIDRKNEIILPYMVEGDTTATYTITYTTNEKVTGKKEVTNKAILTKDNESRDSGDISVDLGTTGGSLKKEGAGIITEDNKTASLTWRVTINPGEGHILKAPWYFNDKFSDGEQSYTAEQKAAIEKVWTDKFHDKCVVAWVNNDKEYNVTVNEDLTEKFSYTYTSKGTIINPDATQEFKNNASINNTNLWSEGKNMYEPVHPLIKKLDGIQITSGDTHYDSTDSKINDNGKIRLKWRVEVAIPDNKKTEIGDVTITDTIPEGMTLTLANVNIGYDLEFTKGGQNLGGRGITAEKEGNTIRLILPSEFVRNLPAGNVLIINYEATIDSDDNWNIGDVKTEKNSVSISDKNGKINGSDDQTQKITKKEKEEQKEKLVTKTAPDKNYFDGNNVKYTVDVNPSGKTLNGNAKTISCVDNLYYDWDIYNPYDVSFVSGSVKVWEVTEFGGKEISDFSYTMDESQEIVNNKTRSHKIINFTLPDSKHLKIEYEYHFSGPSGRWNVLRNTFSINGSSQDSTSSEKSVNTCVSESGGVFDSTGINFYKVDAANYKNLLTGGKFTLKKYVKNQDGQGEWSVVGEGISAEGGLINTSNLITYNVAYWLTEEEAPAGYECGDLGENGYKFILRSTDTIKYPISQPDDFDGEECTTGAAKYLTNSKVQTTSYSIEKVWSDGNNQDGIRPGDLTLTLEKKAGEDGGWTEVTGRTPTVTKNDKTNTWTYSWNELPEKEGGKTLNYRAVEKTVPEGYKNVSSDEKTITNTHIPEVVSASITKIWDDENNRDNKRPVSIEVKLTAKVDGSENKELSKTATLNAVNGWKASWGDLPKYHNGQLVEYSADEVNTPAGYTKSVNGDLAKGFTITNTYTPEKVQVSGSKNWNDGENQDGKRPSSIIIRLYANGSEIDHKTVTEKEGWSWNWTGLNRYDTDHKEISYTISEDAVDGYTTTIGGSNVTNTHEPEKTEVSVSKSWNDDNNRDNKRPDSIEVKLVAKVDGSEIEGLSSGTQKLNGANGWKYTFTDLPKYHAGKPVEYTVEEVNIPAGYTKTITGNATDGFHITNTYTPEKVQVSGSKNWNDGENQDGKRPSSIIIRLYANGSEIGHKTVTEKEGWSWNWTGLNRYDTDHKEISYTISEDAVDGYTTTIGGSNVTNTHEPEKTEVSVSKSWNDDNNRDNKRPDSIEVKLVAKVDGSEIEGLSSGTQKLNGANGWKYTFTDLPKYHAGKPVEYTVEEVNIPAGYTKTITGNATDGFHITNTYTPEKVQVSGSKNWNDGENQDGKRPSSIIIRLYANGSEIGHKTVTEKEGWSWNWTGLNRYDTDHKEISYTISEDAVDGYTTTIGGSNVTNTHEPEKTEVSVSKSWNDDNNRDNKRPDSIEVKLVAKVDGSEIEGLSSGTQKLNGANGWKYTFTDLPKYHAGKPVEYTVEEVNIPAGYTKTITGNATDGFHITNTYTPEKVQVSGSKNWNDGENQDGKRPSSITIRLYANGSEIGHKTVTEKDGWSWNWTGLNRYDTDHKEISYTISEDAVDGYTTTIGGSNVTNTHEPEKTEVSVSKSWNDDNNRDNKRPDSIEVKLVAKVDGSEIEGLSSGTQKLNGANGWKYTFTDLPKYHAGKPVEYTVEEVNIPAGYTKTITGNATDGFHITNTYTPEKVQVSGSKNWNDGENQDGKRPSSIIIRLYANGSEIGHKTVTEKDGWSWNWTGLNRYDTDHKEISYTISEDAVDGYTTTIGGSNVTNTHEPEKTEVSVSKSWNDDNNRDNKRPDSIEVKLVAKVDGSEVEGLSSGTQKLNGANGWKYTFTDLPKYHAGKPVEYTVEEVNIPAGYTKTITGNVTDGFHITNTYTHEKVQVSGSKNWNDDGNAAGTRPGSITIRLYANGSEIDHKTVTEKDGWSWNWTGLNRYGADHKEISYTISEDAVDGYTSSISGYNVTNTVNKPQVGSVILTKVDATTGTALAGAVFDLYRANNTKVGTYTTNAGGVLRVDGLTFGDYYFVETKAPEGYALESQRAAFTINAATTVSAPASVRVTNKPVDEKIGVSAAKVWDDENNTDGVRPSSVTFRLFADGVEIGSAQASEANGWTVSFGNLPKTRNGVAISYAVKEDEVGNYYEASYETGLGSDGSYVFTVKNYRETDKHYEERTGSVRGANRNKPSNGGVAGAGRGRGTGDESDMTVYGTVSGASLLALIVWMIARRKRAGKGTK